jgi:sodium transport system permease protein
MITVALKEIVDNFRDRRVILSTLLLGPLLGPVLLVVLFNVIERQTTERLEQALSLPVIGAEHAPNLIAFLERQGVEIKAAPDDPQQAIRREEEAIILVISAEFAEAWQAGRPAPVELMVDQSLRYTDTTVSRVRTLLNGYSGQISQLRLQLRGVHPDLVRPIQIGIDDQATPEARGGQMLSFLPYFILIMAFVAGMHMATDTTAGERERRSLEPLLINPLPRWQIMGGKLLATTFFGLVALALGLIAFVFAVDFLPIESLDIVLNLDWRVAGLAFVLTAPAALFAAAFLIILASFAKSFREAQSYMGLAIFVPMLPSVWVMINPTRTETWMSAVPLLSQNVLILELVRGEPINGLWFGLSLLTTTLAALLLAAVAASLYSRPRLIFTSD